MRDNLINQGTVLDVALDLFGHRALFGIVIASLLGRKHDIDSGAFAGEYLGIQTLKAQVNRGTIDLVKEESGYNAVDLKSEFGRLDHIEAADEGVHNDREPVAVVDRDSIGLVGHLYDGLVATGDEYRLILLGVDLDNLAWVVEVLDEPLVTFQILTRRLARAHALRLRFLARGRRLGARGGAAMGVGSFWNHRASTKVGVFVGHF